MNFDPANSFTDKLFLFWAAYEKEAPLLEEWHSSTARIRSPIPGGPPASTGNILYNSFLDTWGKDKFVNDLPLDEKSYFSALGTVSSRLRQDCFDVLDKILEKKVDGTFKVPLKLKIDKPTAEQMAQDKISKLLDAFNKFEIPSLQKIDEKARQESDTSPNDDYLKALLRMMLIETRCFEIQKHFLETGTILPEAAPAQA